MCTILFEQFIRNRGVNFTESSRWFYTCMGTIFDINGNKGDSNKSTPFKQSFNIQYSKSKGEFVLPKEIEIRILTAKNNVFIRLEYDRVEINQPQEIYFTIPENYEHCK